MRICKNNKLVRSGFTLIELLIVIIIIGILATITIIGYNGIQDRAHYAKEQEEMRQINQAILLYYADNGTYPLCDTSSLSGMWCGWARSINFIAGLVPKYISKIPNTDFGKDLYSDSYLYSSNGTDYKLIRYSGVDGLLPLEITSNALLDPGRLTNSVNCVVKTSPCAWGYWSDGAKNW